MKPKPAIVPATLQRWIALDAALMGRAWMNVIKFSRTHGVDPRTIFRDLAIFRELGLDTESKPWSDDTPEYVQRYRKGFGPLFARNRV